MGTIQRLLCPQDTVVHIFNRNKVSAAVLTTAAHTDSSDLLGARASWHMTLWLSQPITYQCTGYVPQSLIITNTYFHLFSLCLLKHWIRRQHIDMIPQQCTLNPLDPSLQFSCSPLPMVKSTIVYKALSSLIFSLSSGPQLYAYNSAVTIFYYYIA